MATRSMWSSIFRRRKTAEAKPLAMAAPADTINAPAVPIEIAPNDPLMAYLQTASGTVDVEQLELDSPALRAMKDANIRLAVPLVSQGELIGILNIGPRLSEQDYSADDRTLLNNLASQATPAVRVAQLVRQQEAEAEERQRIEQELQVARLIQHTLLPKSLPQVDGWHLAAHYQPARAVGGDFYDFIELDGGLLGLVVGDVTDKGVPTAFVMATTRSVMRAAAGALTDPGAVLRQVNNALCPDIPANMFVTCLYAILDPKTGRLVYANAGHDAPYKRGIDGVVELRARGMPLGLMPDMEYEEQEATLDPGDTVLFYSDGLVEAHNSQRDMFSFPRLRELMAGDHSSAPDETVDFLLENLAEFTGPEWEQEDDITLVTLQRVQHVASLTAFASDMVQAEAMSETDQPKQKMPAEPESWATLGEFAVPSAEGNERLAIEHVRTALAPLMLPARSVERLETAVGEATMNGMEHGNKFQPEIPVLILVEACDTAARISITDQGDATPLETEEPDLELKLAGMQSPRGWGLFLIKNMVDDLEVLDGDAGHTVRLTVLRKGNDHGDQ